MGKHEKGSVYQRVLVCTLLVFIAGIVGYNIVAVSPVGEISTEVISLLFLLVILTLSEAFDSFSVGSLFSLKKVHDEKVRELNETKEEVKILKQDLINIVTSVSQSQSNVVQVDIGEKVKVEKISQEDVNKKVSDEQKLAARKPDPQRKYRDYCQPTTSAVGGSLGKGELSEGRLLDLYFDQKGINKLNVVHCVKISNLLENKYSSFRNAPIFDAYLNTGDKEIFFELISARIELSAIKKDISELLEVVHQYGLSKKVKAQLVLIFDESDSARARELADIIEPAIMAGKVNVDWVTSK